MIFGDAIHNARSALDHLAWQLVEAGGGTPSKDTAFPVAESPQQYASVIGKGEIKKIHPRARKIIELVQPCNAGDQKLWLLHHLDIVDKHRLLFTTVSSMDKWGIEFASGTTLWFKEPRYIPLVAGDEITNIPTSTLQREEHEDFKIGLDIAFAKPEVVEGELVLMTANRLVNCVDSLIDRFKWFLK